MNYRGSLLFLTHCCNEILARSTRNNSDFGQDSSKQGRSEGGRKISTIVFDNSKAESIEEFFPRKMYQAKVNEL
jgi:hypothetical protein